ncbi:uncharacterized protein K444DRAFT_515187, partial [Hyaloscypha bicolor E]
FIKLKQAIFLVLILYYYNPNFPIIIKTNILNKVIAGILLYLYYPDRILLYIFAVFLKRVSLVI